MQQSGSIGPQMILCAPAMYASMWVCAALKNGDFFALFDVWASLRFQGLFIASPLDLKPY